MSLDGFTISAVVRELRETIVGGRVDKIHQPEKDEIIFNIRNQGAHFKLLISANASHPRLHLTETNQSNPPQPPLFCMVLRKHLAGGKIVAVEQPEFERVISISVESFNEMGDLSVKTCVAELMGKHSNIFLLRDGEILDAAKHISSLQSSVRQVQPGMSYAPPPGAKKNPQAIGRNDFFQMMEENKHVKLQTALLQNYNGISPLMGSDICVRAELDPASFIEELNQAQKENLYQAFYGCMEQTQGTPTANTLYQDERGAMLDFSCIPIRQFANRPGRFFSSPSELLETFYREKDSEYRIKQKTADLRKIVQNNLERCAKKHDIHLRTLQEIKDREQEKIKGEILIANLYALKKGMTLFTGENFYGGDPLDIALDPTLTPSENAQKYFAKYNKGKRAFTALQEQMRLNREDIEYLEGVLTSIAAAVDEADIAEIRDELAETGFVKRVRHADKTKKQKKAKPLHYLSTDGFDIYVGKNNRQNDELTLRFASAGDLWLHTKDIPGSHVIVKTEGKPITDTALFEAAHLAAYYSKARNSAQIPVDYTRKKNVKKPAGAKPGMVIYEGHKTVYMTPEESTVRALTQLP